MNQNLLLTITYSVFLTISILYVWKMRSVSLTWILISLPFYLCFWFVYFGMALTLFDYLKDKQVLNIDFGHADVEFVFASILGLLTSLTATVYLIIKGIARARK